MDINLAKIFENIGFDEKESKTYLALLELGDGIATKISKRAGLKRAIIYHVLERLKKRGYVQELKDGKVKKFSASDPSRVLQNASAAAESLRVVMPIVKAMQEKGLNKPKIEYFDNKEAIVAVYRSFSSAKSLRYLASIKRLFDVIPDEVVRWTDRLRNKRLKSKEKYLLQDSKEDREWVKLVDKAGQEAKIMTKGLKIYTDFTIADDILCITSFDPFYVVVIHSPGIAVSAAQIFDIVWLSGLKV
jgi:sugar-specific transcriptional regulator TrmB